jgi:hypothetical protein
MQEGEMEREVRGDVRKVQLFSRFARAACGLAMVFMGLGLLWLMLGVLFGFRGIRVSFGPYLIEGADFTTPFLKAWGTLFLGVIFALVFRWLGHLYALFSNLAAGSIYTKENVQRIRQVALFMLYMQGLIIVLGGISWAILKAGLIDESIAIPQSFGITGATFVALLGPGLVLLASWIMEVGRRTQDEADDLRRDAELVI